MLRGSHTHDLWVLKDQLSFKKVARRINVTQSEFELIAISDAFAHWQEVAAELKKLKIEQDQRNRFVDILRNSTRCQRSTMEKEEIRRFISGHLTCIPKSINFSEMDMLCNELDWIPFIGRSILFLQGDFGNCYYMIANGRRSVSGRQ
jgi:UDP-2,3-diacylglucosamine pyrophosphatase LpxH